MGDNWTVCSIPRGPVKKRRLWSPAPRMYETVGLLFTGDKNSREEIETGQRSIDWSLMSRFGSETSTSWKGSPGDPGGPGGVRGPTTGGIHKGPRGPGSRISERTRGPHPDSAPNSQVQNFKDFTTPFGFDFHQGENEIHFWLTQNDVEIEGEHFLVLDSQSFWN